MQLQRKKEIWILLQVFQIGIIHNTGAQRTSSSSGVPTTTYAYPRQSTTEPNGYWGTGTSSSVQTTRQPNGNIHDGAAHTNPSNLQSGRSTTTTRRSLIVSQLQSTTNRPSILPHYPTTTRSPTSDFWATSSTSTESFWHTTRRYQTTTERYYELHRPTINFTVTDSKNNLYFPKWNGVGNEAVLHGANALREFTLEFRCNASYPIEWLSQRPFGTKEWDIDEIRHFEEPENRNIMGIILKLKKYEKLESLPNNMEFSCSDVRERERDTLQSSIKITKGANSTLKFVVSRDFSQWPTVSGLPPKYSEPRGRNTGCSVQLRWLPHDKMFSCSMEAPANISFDYLERNCYDETTCQRIYTKEHCSETGFSRWRNSKTEHKAPADIWSTGENFPSSGIVYCQRDGEAHDNKSAALPFFHSLKTFCPEDDARTRQQLYVYPQPQPTDSILERDFISLCAAKSDLRFNNASLPYVVYAGDNMTISCISSFYHFALATRIGFQFRNGTMNHIVPMDFKLTPERDSGFMNFTTKVCVDSAEVTGIVCENYRKKSTASIQKRIPLRVKLPINVTVENEESNAGLTAWVYTGNPGFSIRCKARGDPQPSITWHKQGRPISTDILEDNKKESQVDTVSVLIFPSFTNMEKVNELHGTYTCKAENRLLDVAEKTFVVTHPNSSTTQIVVDPSGNRISGGDDNIGLILGIVVPIVVLLVTAIVGFLVWKIKRQNQELKLLSKAEVDEFIFGKPEFLQHHSSSEEVNNYAPFLPYNKGYEIGREQLEIDMSTVLGSGAYAIVLRGTVHRRGDQTRVAVKTAKPMDDVGYFKALLSELKIMGFIGSHPNIVNLVGAYTKNIQNREIFIAIEYCENGNVLSYLRDNRQRYKNYVSQDGEIMTDVVITEESFVHPNREGLTTITLMKWAEEIAYGMEFLSNKKVIHGDLAARNILLTEHLVAKIGDFGLSRQLFEYANYIKKQQSPLPWKWLALECLQDMKFSVKSDVWAYSILLFEIFSLDELVSGKRPNKPPSATKDVYKLMQSCWEEDPQTRPTFTQIKEFFSSIISTLVPQGIPQYMDLHERVTSTSTSFVLPTVTTNAVVHQPPCSSGTEQSTDGNEDKKHRFSFNTKTITALFHR